MTIQDSAYKRDHPLKKSKELDDLILMKLNKDNDRNTENFRNKHMEQKHTAY